MNYLEQLQSELAKPGYWDLMKLELAQPGALAEQAKFQKEAQAKAQQEQQKQEQMRLKEEKMKLDQQKLETQKLEEATKRKEAEAKESALSKLLKKFLPAKDQSQNLPKQYLDSAKQQMSDVKFSIHPLSSQGTLSTEDVGGEYRPAGVDINNTVAKLPFLNDNAKSWIVQHVPFKGLDKANIDLASNDTTVFQHEFLHHLFEKSPMGPTFTIGDNPNKNAEFFGNKFMDAWDKAAQDQDAPMQMIDKHIQDSYDTSQMNRADMATERFAYLGELVGKYGVDVIPKPLRKFYQTVFKF